jgi:hypothetical protein
MMTDPVLYAMIAISSLAAIAILSFVGLKGFNNWLALQRAAIDAKAEPASSGASPMNRIEVADLKERVRKLEAIAAGVDL